MSLCLSFPLTASATAATPSQPGVWDQAPTQLASRRSGDWVVLDPPQVWLLSCPSDTTGLSSFHTRWAGGGVTSDLLGGLQGEEACEGPGLPPSCASCRLGLPLPERPPPAPSGHQA